MNGVRTRIPLLSGTAPRLANTVLDAEVVIRGLTPQSEHALDAAFASRHGPRSTLPRTGGDSNQAVRLETASMMVLDVARFCDRSPFRCLSVELIGDGGALRAMAHRLTQSPLARTQDGRKSLVCVAPKAGGHKHHHDGVHATLHTANLWPSLAWLAAGSPAAFDAAKLDPTSAVCLAALLDASTTVQSTWAGALASCAWSYRVMAQVSKAMDAAAREKKGERINPSFQSKAAPWFAWRGDAALRLATRDYLSRKAARALRFAARDLDGAAAFGAAMRVDSGAEWFALQDRLQPNAADGAANAFVSIDPVPEAGSAGGFIGQMSTAKAVSGAALGGAMGNVGDRLHPKFSDGGASTAAKAFATSLALVQQANTRGQIHFFGPRMSEVAVDGARASRSGSLAATPVAVMLQSGHWEHSMALVRRLWPSHSEAVADSRQRPVAANDGVQDENPADTPTSVPHTSDAERLLARRQATALRGLTTASLASSDPSLARALFTLSVRHLQRLRRTGGPAAAARAVELGDVVSLDQLSPLSCSVGHAIVDLRLREAAVSAEATGVVEATAAALGIALPSSVVGSASEDDDEAAARSSLLLDTLSHVGPCTDAILHVAGLPAVPTVSIATAARLAAMAARVGALPERHSDQLFADLAALAEDGPNSRMIAVRVWDKRGPAVMSTPWRAPEFNVLALGEKSGHWLPGELFLDDVLEQQAVGVPQALSLASILAAGAAATSSEESQLSRTAAPRPHDERPAVATKSGDEVDAALSTTVSPKARLPVRLLHSGPVSVLCKPARMLSTLAVPEAVGPEGQPRRMPRPTVEGVVAAEALWRDADAPAPSRHGCGMLSRLDRGTSGLVPVACDAAALDGAVRGSHVGRSSAKEYIAICVGLPDGAPLAAVPQTSSLLSRPEGEDAGPGPWVPLVSVVDRLGLVQHRKGSDQAATLRSAASLSRSRVDARVVKVFDKVPLGAVGLKSKQLKKRVDAVPIVVVRVRAETAKRHEVRQHLAACGYPILNDVTASLDAAVSTQVLPSARFALHATTAAVMDATPRHRQAIVEEALPSDLAAVLRRIDENE